MSLEDLKNIAERHSFDDEAWFRLANAYVSQEMWENAIPTFERAISIRHEYAANHYDPANTLASTANILDAAFDYYQRTLEMEADYASCYLHYGYYLHGNLQTAEAETAYRKATEINPEFAVAYLELGNIEYDRSNYSLAIECFNKAIACNPDYAEAYCNIGNCLANQGMYEGAIACYEKAFGINPNLPDLLGKLNQIYVKFVPRWHFPMMNDEYRNNCYERALKRAIGDDSIVLDIGSGSGLLAMMAARAGASHVYTCEKVKPIANIARQIIQANGYSARITAFNKMSNDLKIGSDLAEPADVLVSEILDVGLLAEYVVPSVRHARSELLKPNAKIIPKSATVYAVLLDSIDIFHEDRVQNVSGFDLSLFNAFSNRSSYLQLFVRHFPYQSLSEQFEVFTFDFDGDDIKPETRNLSVPIIQSGTCHAIAFWFGLWLDDEIYLETSPFVRDTCWMQAVYIMESPPSLELGQIVTVNASHDTTHINLKLVC
ncbi:tetratricopeptide repeat protein [Pseudanabaena sp. PCC 6802]|uniref:tetratricopeptide repeat protein n=1 Tax=Pseudanabaena sp. PCC 6802 TaxID=118173 RepID=UPI000346E5D5|nr:tetratricopeptide repeat protein [Pseudanabaena sp. PCC 6802]